MMGNKAMDYIHFPRCFIKNNKYFPKYDVICKRHFFSKMSVYHDFSLNKYIFEEKKKTLTYDIIFRKICYYFG